MKRAAQQLRDQAEALGYVHESTNTRGHFVYTHPSGHTLRINPSCTDDQAHNLAKAMRKAAGVPRGPGRSAKAAKVRQAKQRERLAAERRKVAAAHAEYLARIERAPLLRGDPAVVRRIEAYERELAELDRLMRAAPAGGDHQGRRHAQHTAGSRP